MRTIVRPAALSSWSSGHDVGAGVAVEVAGRLVGEDQRGFGDERPGDGDALLLAARQLGRLVVEPVAQAEPLEGRRGARRALAARDALVEQGRGDVVERRRARQQVVRLEDEADGPAAEPGQAVVVELRDGRPGEAVLAAGSGGRGSPGCSSSWSCPSPDGPTIATNSPGMDLEADVDECRDLHPAHVVDAADVVERDDRVGHRLVAAAATADEPPPPTTAARDPEAAARGPAGRRGRPGLGGVDAGHDRLALGQAARDLGSELVTSPTSTGWAVGTPSAPRTRTV